MNEEHIIAAILTSGHISQDRRNIVLSPFNAMVGRSNRPRPTIFPLPCD